MRRFLVLLTFLGLIATPLYALDEDGDRGEDIVHFGSNVTVRSGETANDIVCFLCSVEVEGTVHRDIVVFLGSVRVNGAAEHDVVVFAGNVSVGDNASIGHDVVIMGGNRHLASTGIIGHDSVIFPPIVIALPFLIIFGIILAIVRLIRWLVLSNRPVYHPPYP
jgi:acetyltransferase-like isoleucine patch superfamily enzyme